MNRKTFRSRRPSVSFEHVPPLSSYATMWSSKLFRNFFVSFSLLIVVSLVLFSIFVARGQKRELLGQSRRQLRIASSMLAELAESQPIASSAQHGELQNLVRALGQRLQIRLTLVTADGQVVADSDRETIEAVRRMDNHGDRPEIQAALRNGSGFGARYSKTLKEALLYAAHRYGSGESPTGVARAAMSQRSIEQQVRTGRWMVALFAGTVTLIGLLGTRYLLVGIVTPVLKITKAVDRMTTGTLGVMVEIPNRDEFGTLARSFNELNRDMESRIEQLRQRGDQLAAVLRGMVEGVVAVDRETRILFANDAAGEQFDFQPEATQGRPLLALIRDEVLYRSVRDALASGKVVTSEIRRHSPVSRALAVHATPLPGDPCPGVVIVLYDMTRIRRLESLRQEFVANVSHELKTPLSSIKAYAETLRAGAINDEENNVKFVQRIEDQADRLNQLIMDLIRLARIESGEQAFDVEDVELVEAVQLSLKEHLPSAEAKSIDLRSDPPGESLVVRADDEAMRQILENLVNNAIKYTPAGGQVTVSWRRANEMALIEVKDTGLGIEKAHQSRLFERFYRVDKARSRELGGTGLGLSIVKHLVQFFGGSVGVESVVGKGSTFWVRLPLRKPSDVGRRSTLHDGTSGSSARGRAR